MNTAHSHGAGVVDALTRIGRPGCRPSLDAATRMTASFIPLEAAAEVYLKAPAALMSDRRESSAFEPLPHGLAWPVRLRLDRENGEKSKRPEAGAIPRMGRRDCRSSLDASLLYRFWYRRGDCIRIALRTRRDAVAGLPRPGAREPSRRPRTPRRFGVPTRGAAIREERAGGR